ncbi:Shedu anti-phage system protein SduA domain-containing protein [Clostridium sp. Cult3]|uniref:Shedu anti-phage system protein SduA domain-containing protein n=1 Tax=Clostridium sp. Cult3 TaxID=2079004 RepID=UPI001F261B95|nr:Shedu anti-phage system protein SduA domain-containing protein [Clostridium sp. Cult3]MCF6460862.1 DUF4263 domain-containing protein [Clostridium sp. Cult3]
MKLFARDYQNITADEKELEREIRNKYTIQLGKIKAYNSNMHREFPKAIRHHNSLFPNNYLDPVDLKDETKLKVLNQQFLKTIEDRETIETDILKFIKENRAYHIIGSIFSEYSFGHHDAYLFREFQLGNSYQVEYLLVGKSSDGYNFIFIEFENPYGRISLANEEFGDVIRKGLSQVSDWMLWTEESYSSLSESFEKETNNQLPKEFYRLDTSRMNYAVVAGRRNDYKEKTNNDVSI